jgi:uncharacterized protein (DUF1015 family)
MADIHPFRAWRYNSELTEDIESLTSPLFDVVSDKQRDKLYRNKLNSIHISVPQPPFAADRAALILKDWKENKVIRQDKLPAIYVYYQYFRLPGLSRELCRKGFMCNIRLHAWEENIIQRHENTIPKAVNDRIEILEKTELQVSPTHGLYTDADFTLEKYMDEAITSPVLETEDYQGVRDVLGIIQDGKVVRHFMEALKGKKIILADGHHRYEGALAHLHNQKRANPNHTGNEGYNFHFMYLTNTEGGDLRILPTHRLINGIKGFDENAVLEKLNQYFIIKPIDDPNALNEIIHGKRWAFGLIFKHSAYKIRLKEESFAKLRWPFPPVVKELDLTVMHYFVIEKALGIPGKQQRKTELISFDRNFTECMEKVHTGQHQMAIITNEISIDEVKRVCESGFTMPQKSTYFYPKIVSGFVFSSIRENEFRSLPFSPFLT